MELEWSNESVVLQATDRPGIWRTAEPLEYRFEGVQLRVPRGFQTDLASVPRILWPILPPWGHYTAAAVLHDWLYIEQAVMGEPISRGFADRAFLEAMKDLRVRITRRRAMYRGVRTFGWIPWLRNKTRRR